MAAYICQLAQGLDVLDVDEAGKDSLSDWMTKYPPMADIPSHKPGRVHLYYQSRGPLHNKNPFHLQQYGLRVEIRSRHGFVVLWDPEAVAELVAERSMASTTRGMIRLPRGGLGAKASRCPWTSAAATQGVVPQPRSLAGKPLAGFRATPDSRIIVLCGMIVSVIRFKNHLLHRQSSLRKRPLGENRGFRPSF